MSSPPPNDDNVLEPAMVQALQTLAQNVLVPLLADRDGHKSNKKRSSSDPEDQENNDQTSEQKDYNKSGRQLSRQIDMFTNIDSVVNFAIIYETREVNSGDDDSPASLSEHDQRLLATWNLLLRCIPDIKMTMLALASQRKVRRKLCGVTTEHATKACTDDRSSLKSAIVRMILVDPVNETLTPPIDPKCKVKKKRGFTHPATAFLLTPLKYPATQETYNAMRAGTMSATAAMLPRFLFPQDQVYNSDDRLANVLRGHLLTRAAKHIFMGPSTALEGPGSHRGKQGNAALSDITNMTPHIIAYVAVQVRFALTSSSQWSTIDGKFNYQDFYWRIVALFEDETERKEHLAHFNYHVFGKTNPSASSDSAIATDDDEDDYEIAKQQRAAKRARLEAD